MFWALLVRDWKASLQFTTLVWSISFSFFLYFIVAFNLSYIWYGELRTCNSLWWHGVCCFPFLMKGLWIFIEGNSFIDSLFLLPGQWKSTHTHRTLLAVNRHTTAWVSHLEPVTLSLSLNSLANSVIACRNLYVYISYVCKCL